MMSNTSLEAPICYHTAILFSRIYHNGGSTQDTGSLVGGMVTWLKLVLVSPIVTYVLNTLRSGSKLSSANYYK